MDEAIGRRVESEAEKALQGTKAIVFVGSVERRDIS
jgi:hypothetical protein